MIRLPVRGRFTVTAVYGQDGAYWSNSHAGIDFTAENRNIYSVCDGTVRVVGWDEGGWGRYISIGDSDGNRHIYCHLKDDSVTVRTGTRVSIGQVIAVMGSTGNSTGIHLHYQINDAANRPRDPSVYLGIPNTKGSYDSINLLGKENAMEKYNDWTDVSVWARESVEAVTDSGIMQGDEKGNFHPKANLTREEAAVILARLLNEI